MVNILNINSWLDFYENQKSLDKLKKGKLFELLVFYYFQLTPIYKLLYKKVWLWEEIPSHVLDELNLPSNDIGIDILLKSEDGYHAVQCKFHSDLNSNVGLSEVSTFLNLIANVDKVSHGYICSTAISTSSNYNKSPKIKQISLLMREVWEGLDKDFFKSLHLYIDNGIFEIKPYSPLEHQSEAINQAFKYYCEDKNTRGKLIFPCGAGKTLTGFWISEILKSKKTLIIVPSLSLIKQTLDVWLREIVALNQSKKWLCVCSDDSVSMDIEIQMNIDEIGVPCTTDVLKIQSWLNKNSGEDIVVFSTYQSSKVLAECFKGFSFDLGIFDEAHKTVGTKDRLFSMLLNDECLYIKSRLFMTATERFYRGKNGDVVSMDNEDVYGEVFSKLSFKAAIQSKILSDYKIVTINVSNQELNEFLKEQKYHFEEKGVAYTLDSRSIAAMIATRKAMNLYNIKNVISFHSSIKRSEANMAFQPHLTRFSKLKEVYAFTINGKMATSQRNRILSSFSFKQNSIITNARCLTEGVDVPNVDGVVFVDPKKSKIDIVQAMGRVLRKFKGKENGFIILPVIYDEESLEVNDDNFTDILSVIKGISSTDERIIDYIRGKKKDEVNRNITEDLEDDIFEFAGDRIIDLNVLSERLKVRLWDHLAANNYRSFEESKNFVQSLSLNSEQEWRDYTKSKNKPKDIPVKPDKVYKFKGWNGYADFLGYKAKGKSKEFLSYEEAKSFISKLGISSNSEWRDYCKSGGKPDNIPSNPHQTYKDLGWVDINHWLGKDAETRIKKIDKTSFVNYEKSKEWVQNKGITCTREWTFFKRNGTKPDYIPSHPERFYKGKGWIDFSHWFGTKNQRSKSDFLDYEDAREFIIKSGINSHRNWRKFKEEGRRPDYIPSHPERFYKDKGWIDFSHWFGKE